MISEVQQNSGVWISNEPDLLAITVSLQALTVKRKCHGGATQCRLFWSTDAWADTQLCTFPTSAPMPVHLKIPSSSMHLLPSSLIVGQCWPFPLFSKFWVSHQLRRSLCFACFRSWATCSPCHPCYGKIVPFFVIAVCMFFNVDWLDFQVRLEWL